MSRIEKGSDADNPNPKWKKLYQQWLSEKKPGYVSVGGTTYRVLHPSDDDISFVQMGGMDDMYGSSSTEAISG